MIRVAITDPTTLPIATHSVYFDRQTQLAPILESYGVEIVPEVSQADFEIRCGIGLLQGPPLQMPKERLIIVDGEPPQPEFLLPYYKTSGFADVLCPANLRAHSPDGMAYFVRPTEPLPEARFRSKMLQLSTFRSYRADVMSGSVNEQFPYEWRLLCTQRCDLGLELQRLDREFIDICGRGWPEGTTIEDTRGGDWQARKMSLLNSYGFNLCWENMEIPYYVSEKLWDPILAGSLPVYWGPPEMHDRLPKDSIVDCRPYADDGPFDAEGLLWDLKEMSEEEWTRRVSTLREWLMDFPEDIREQGFKMTAHDLARSILEATQRVIAAASSGEQASS